MNGTECKPKEDISAVIGRLSGGSTVLVSIPHDDNQMAERVVGTVPAGGPRSTHLVTVIDADATEDVAGQWRTRPAAARADGLGIVSLGERVRSAAGATSTTALPTAPISISPIANPDNLAAIGAAIDDQLLARAEESVRVVVCVPALSTLLATTDRARVIRFLASVIDRIQEAGAIGCLYIDSDAQDPAAVDRMQTLVDETIEA